MPEFMKSGKPNTFDPEIAELLERAEQARRRRIRDGLTFSSVRALLKWYFRMARRMSTPHNMHPQTVALPDGSRARISVDGGRGGDIDEVLATLVSVSKALEYLRLDEPIWWYCLVAFLGEGKAQGEIARKMQMTQSAVSLAVGRGESYLAGLLRDALG